MKITIFETEHFEAAYPVIRLFDNGQNNIQICCYPLAFRQLQHRLPRGGYKWLVKKEEQSRLGFVRTIYRACKEQQTDLLYLNTVADNFIGYAILAMLLPRTRIILTVHMVNNLTHTKKTGRLRRMVRHAGKKALCRMISEFNIISPTLEPALRAAVGPHKKIHQIPGGIYEPGMMQPTQPDPLALLRLAIPGSVDTRRRDYEFVWELLACLEQRQVRAELVLLGGFYGSYGEPVQAKTRDWKGSFVRVRYYSTEHIDQPEFDRVLNESHFVFSPSVIHTVIADDVEEVYGETIVSGNISDAIRHAKPLVIPEGLKTDPALRPACITYASADQLAGTLQQVQNEEGKYEQILRTAEKTMRLYTAAYVKAQNKDVFLD